MVASKDSWKWKVAVGVIGFIIFAVAFVFTETGRTTMMGWMNDAYNETPEADRVTQKAADYWLTLSWFEGFIKTNGRQANDMYREFLGIMPDPKNAPKSFFQVKDETGVAKWIGKFDGRTKTGWGPLHARAPEAYYDFMRVWERDQSATYIGEYAKGYYTLFFKIYPVLSRTGKPHPLAYKYYYRIKVLMNKYQVPIPRDVPKNTFGFEDEDQTL